MLTLDILKTSVYFHYVRQLFIPYFMRKEMLMDTITILIEDEDKDFLEEQTLKLKKRIKELDVIDNVTISEKPASDEEKSSGIILWGELIVTTANLIVALRGIITIIKEKKNDDHYTIKIGENTLNLCDFAKEDRPKAMEDFITAIKEIKCHGR